MLNGPSSRFISVSDFCDQIKGTEDSIDLSLLIALDVIPAPIKDISPRLQSVFGYYDRAVLQRVIDIDRAIRKNPNIKIADLRRLPT